MRFEAQTTKPGPLAIHELLQRHANELWVPEHLDEAQAAAFVADHFRRHGERQNVFFAGWMISFTGLNGADGPKFFHRSQS